MNLLTPTSYWRSPRKTSGSARKFWTAQNATALREIPKEINKEDWNGASTDKSICTAYFQKIRGNAPLLYERGTFPESVFNGKIIIRHDLPQMISHSTCSSRERENGVLSALYALWMTFRKPFTGWNSSFTKSGTAP